MSALFSDDQVFLLSGFLGAQPTAENAKIFGSHGPAIEDASARILADHPNFQLSGALSLSDLRTQVTFLEGVQASAPRSPDSDTPDAFSDAQVFLLSGFLGVQPTAENAKVFGSHGGSIEEACARVLADHPNFQLSGALSLSDLRSQVLFLEGVQASASQESGLAH